MHTIKRKISGHRIGDVIRMTKKGIIGDCVVIPGRGEKKIKRK